jgi:hypothetical protein
MFSFFIFILSGVAILSLTLAKRFEMKGYRVIVFRAVSKGDERARDLYHKSLRFYSEGKVKTVFFVRKQLPVRLKIYTNRSVAWLQARFEERFGDMRGSRFIVKGESGSDFVKSVAEVEKGRGELHDDVYIAEEEPPVIEAVRATPEAFVTVSEPPIPAAISITQEEVVMMKPKKPRAPRKPRAKKIKVLEVSEY